jgi:hypothetical protein
LYRRISRGKLALKRDELRWLNSQRGRNLPKEMKRGALPAVLDVYDRSASNPHFLCELALAEALGLSSARDPFTDRLVKPVVAIAPSHAVYDAPAQVRM